MQFTPKSEKEIQESRLLPAGEYPFEVVSAKDTVSQSGNDMIALQLRVFKPDGGSIIQRDWLLESIEYKLRHFAESVGLLKEYGLGELTADMCEGRSGTLKLAQKDDKTYGPQNTVKDYVKPEVGIERPAPPDDDELPF